jgi:hypothetical protein
MCRQRLRALESDLGGGSAENRRWREQMALHHYQMSRAVRRKPALLGTESGSGVGLSALDVAILEDASAGRVDRLERGAAGQPATDREQRKISHPAVGLRPRTRQQILALSARHMPRNWERDYGHRPTLLETLVDGSRFRGTCYRAANWLNVGQTAGRSRTDRGHKAHGQAVKDVYVDPLVQDARQQLCGDLIR